MIIKTIAILGGTGFVGRHLVNALGGQDYRIRVLTRRRERHRELLVIPTLDLIESDVHDPNELTRQLAGCDAVINLVGVLNERGDDGSGFRHAHVDLARHVVEACRSNPVHCLLHMSALNADATVGRSHYLKTKGEAEDLVHQAAGKGLRITSFRPSVIFGPDDSFFNRFARLLRLSPYFFPLACPRSRFAPVYVTNVAEAFMRALEDPATAGRRYDLCGPKQYTLQELVQYTATSLHLRRRILPLNEGLSYLQAQVLERIPGKPMSLDNYRSLQVPSVCQGESGLAALGIEPVAIEAVVPAYLQKQNQRARYRVLRTFARRR